MNESSTFSFTCGKALLILLLPLIPNTPVNFFQNGTWITDISSYREYRIRTYNIKKKINASSCKQVQFLIETMTSYSRAFKQVRRKDVILRAKQPATSIWPEKILSPVSGGSPAFRGLGKRDASCQRNVLVYGECSGLFATITDVEPFTRWCRVWNTIFSVFFLLLFRAINSKEIKTILNDGVLVVRFLLYGVFGGV